MVKVIITLFFSDLQELNEVAHNCLFLLFSFILFFFLSLSLFLPRYPIIVKLKWTNTRLTLHPTSSVQVLLAKEAKAKESKGETILLPIQQSPNTPQYLYSHRTIKTLSGIPTAAHLLNVLQHLN